MRMWLVNPKCMCRKHLLGEHVEMHMFKGSILKNKNLSVFENGLLLRGEIKRRHDALVKEMISRGYNHKTPMDRFNEGIGGYVKILNNIKDLSNRCPECRKLLK